VKRFIRENKGSASLEFVILAIPLFLPILIFMNRFADISDAEGSLRSLARESARAYVTSANDRIAHQVLSEVIAEGSAALGYSDSVRYSVRCSQTPCIYPNGRVSVTVMAMLPHSQEVTITAIEYVSPWS